VPGIKRDVAVLVDTGPIVSVFDENDPDHDICIETMRAIRCPLITVWPVITEAMHLLSRSPQVQDRLWELIVRGSLRLSELTTENVQRMRQLMRKYSDLPMALADAALVSVAERENLRTIFTLDRDFGVYAPSHLRSFRILPPLRHVIS
jgi:predicted nucleic acid-binding protein